MKRIFSRLATRGSLNELRNCSFVQFHHHEKIVLMKPADFNFQHLHKFSTAAVDEDKKEIQVQYSNGLPVINVRLPSRQEFCCFTLKPITSNVGDLIRDLKNEDYGIDRANVYTNDGVRVASSTQIGLLLQSNFILSINDQKYIVQVPPMEAAIDDPAASLESVERLANSKALIGQLYSRLNIEEHQLKSESDLQAKLENLKAELAPLQEIRDSCERKAVMKTKLTLVGGMTAMAAQYGILARLTWWEYSWDIMEPVTYFITSGYALLAYGYFLLTQQEYIYPAARDRVYLKFFYTAAKKEKLDINRYNALIQELDRTESCLRRLRDPLELHLPVEPPKPDVIPTTWKKGEL